jgi:hypothetical protein
MWELLLVAIILAVAMLKVREGFVMKYGNPFDEEDIVSFEPDAKGKRLFGITPDSCPADKSEYDAGLCYERCESGYNGVGPVCWAQTESVGVGKPVGLEPCPAGWSNDGLICREPLRWDSCKHTFFGLCVGGLRGGRLKGRLDGGGICDWPSDRGNLPDWLVDKSDPKDYKATHPDRVAGLCYRKCPESKPDRVPGMPYLCYKNIRGFSYGRGVGQVPPIITFGE